MHRSIAALAALALGASAAAAGSAGPARAAARYDFAVGGGTAARYWQTSQWNPGTCTIDVDHGATKSAPQFNQGDAVVLSPAELGLLGRTVPVSWGATAPSPTGGRLLVRLVYVGTGCPHTDLSFTASTFGLGVPANTRFIVVTAAEGTVQPWFTI